MLASLQGERIGGKAVFLCAGTLAKTLAQFPVHI